MQNANKKEQWKHGENQELFIITNARSTYISRECWGLELSLPMHGAWKAGAVQTLVHWIIPAYAGSTHS